ncbi:MAG: FtsX-like permease family protein [Ferruginibacter sp.]
MIKNYFKTAWRTLLRNKGYAAINIAGLAVGIAVCLVIFVVIRFESSFDGFHTNKDRIYRVLSEFHTPKGNEYNPGVPFPLPRAFRNDFPQLEKVTTITTTGNDQILVLNEQGTVVKKFKEERGVFFAEPEFLDIFNFPLLSGNKSSLAEPNTTFLTKDIAEKYFGNWQDAIGKTIKRNNTLTLKVVGVLENTPVNSDFQIKALASYSSIHDKDRDEDWESINSSYGCYFLAAANFDEAAFNKQLMAFSKKYRAADNTTLQAIQSISKVHADDKTGNYLDRAASKEMINTMWLIAAFILVIACVNFINLSTAQAVNRSQEVGVRKVLGSNRSQLVLQFFCETFLIVSTAVVLAVGITYLLLPAVARIMDIPLATKAIGSASVIIFCLAAMIVVTLLAGFYPAIILSGFNPITALKSKVAAGRTKGVSLRRGLVVTQFVIAQSLIIGTLMIIKQMDFFQHTSMGFDKEAIINVPMPRDSASLTKVDYLQNRLQQMKTVQQVSFSYSSPADNGNWNSDIKYDHAAKGTDFGVNLKWADAGYIKTYSIPLIAGRNIYPSDTVREFLVNETLLKKLGVTNPQDAINKEIDMWDGQMKGPIVGVVKDFNARSFREGIEPVLIASRKQFYSIAGIKLSQQNMPQTIAAVEKLWNQAYPDYVFEFKFLDAKVAGFYKQERRMSNLYTVFAILSIFLSCLGLYGLASFMAVQRLKEVGVRKVLGASMQSIVYLFSKEFMILIAVAFAIAAPLTWYFLQQWLQDFQYRINLSWWIFLLGGIASLIVALTTISFKAIRAAQANPVKSLRSE